MLGQPDLVRPSVARGPSGAPRAAIAGTFSLSDRPKRRACPVDPDLPEPAMLRLIRAGISVVAQLNGTKGTGRSPCPSLFLDQPAVSIEPEVHVVPISIAGAKTGHPGMPPACPVRCVSQLDPVGEPRFTPAFRIVGAPDEIVARSSVHVSSPGGEDHIERRDIAIGEPPSEELVLDGLPAATDAEREVARWRALFGRDHSLFSAAPGFHRRAI